MSLLVKGHDEVICFESFLASHNDRTQRTTLGRLLCPQALGIGCAHCCILLRAVPRSPRAINHGAPPPWPHRKELFITPDCSGNSNFDAACSRTCLFGLLLNFYLFECRLKISSGWAIWSPLVGLVPDRKLEWVVVVKINCGWKTSSCPGVRCVLLKTCKHKLVPIICLINMVTSYWCRDFVNLKQAVTLHTLLVVQYTAQEVKMSAIPQA